MGEDGLFDFNVGKLQNLLQEITADPGVGQLDVATEQARVHILRTELL